MLLCCGDDRGNSVMDVMQCSVVHLDTLKWCWSDVKWIVTKETNGVDTVAHLVWDLERGEGR